MKKIKMAIVSSYSESCGNASFTRVLHDSIEEYSDDMEVDVIELDLKLLQSVDGKIRKKADKHINDICGKLKLYNIVNIQMEAGLYGTFPHDIVSRFKKIVAANSNTSVTLHSPRLIPNTHSSSRSAIKKIIQLKIIKGIKELIGERYHQIHLLINRKIIRAAIKKNAHLIVHTSRAQKQINNLFSYDKVTVHPLKIAPTNHSPDPGFLESLSKYAGLKKTDVLIGMFGYISAYKGHVDAFNALRLLPDNFKLLIFGRQHPQTLKSTGQIDQYLERLITMCLEDDALKDRIFFMGELTDPEFMNVLSTIDVAWLPYYENGQDGSGIASLCLDLCPNVLCSTSFAFDELFKLVKYNNVKRFDIGNIAEMATKTKMMLNAPKPVSPFCDPSIYSLKTQAAAYVRELTS